MIKVVILHPPLYPMNHKLFDILGKYVDLIVYSFGEHPRLHTNWSIYDYQEEAENYEIKVFGKGALNIKTQLSFYAFFELCKDKPDVVLSVAFWLPSLYSSLLKKVLGFNFLIITDAISETEINISKARIFLRKIISKRTDAVISASVLTTKYIRTLCPNMEIKPSMQTIDVATWISEIDSLSDKNTLREELGLPIRKKIILGVGNFIYKKNWETIFRQMKYLNECLFILIGAGELEIKYKEYVEVNKLQDKVILVSRKEGTALKKYFKAADLFAFPSLYDQFGYVVLEALCSGLPVICSSNTGASSLIENKYNGWIVDPNEDFVSEINKVLSDRKKMSQNASLSMKEYTLENKANEYVRIIEEYCVNS